MIALAIVMSVVVGGIFGTAVNMKFDIVHVEKTPATVPPPPTTWEQTFQSRYCANPYQARCRE